MRTGRKPTEGTGARGRLFGWMGFSNRDGDQRIGMSEVFTGDGGDTAKGGVVRL